jgi:hypothetical protein
MMFDADSIPWNKTVEMFEAGPGIVVNVREMTLREAVECFRDMPEAERWAYGVGIHEPCLMTMDSRPVAVGFLNASSLIAMIRLLPAGE